MAVDRARGGPANHVVAEDSCVDDSLTAVVCCVPEQSLRARQAAGSSRGSTKAACRGQPGHSVRVRISLDTILVALDASPRAPRVLAVAVEVARKFAGRVVLFRAIGVPHANELPAESIGEAPGVLQGILEQHAEHDLDALARDVPPELLKKVSVHIGVAWQAICRAAAVEGADLVVIGSHGYGGYDRILGTTAAKVVNHADRSVLVVRDVEVPEAKR